MDAVSAPVFERWDRFLGGYQYATPVGSYTLAESDGHGVWVLATAGGEVGRYRSVELAEAAGETDVKQRMWN